MRIALAVVMIGGAGAIPATRHLLAIDWSEDGVTGLNWECSSDAMRRYSDLGTTISITLTPIGPETKSAAERREPTIGGLPVVLKDELPSDRLFLYGDRTTSNR